MTPGAMVFLVASWGLVLGLAAWAFREVFRAQARRNPDAPPDGGDAG